VFTINYFQCYDIALTNGLNAVTVHAMDLAGNTTTTNVNVTLDYSGDTTPPALTVVWPQDGTYVSGSNFTFEGQVDDLTATITAQIVDAGGNTNAVRCLIERSGLVWADNLPLAAGANTLTLTATDAAGNANTTQLTLYQSSITVTMDPLSIYQLNQSSVTVYGTVSDATAQVYVNGIGAYYIDDEGDWEADGVPVSPTGMAIFDMEVYGGSNPGMMARARTGLRLAANDLPSGTATGSTLIKQPQPARIGLMSYLYKLTSPVGVHNANWNYSSGGDYLIDTIYDDYDTTFPPGDAGADALATWIGSAYFQWENNSGANNRSVAWKTETHVMIEPSGQTTAGGMNLYLVSAQVWGESFDANGSESYRLLDPQTVKIQGAALTSVTNEDDGSVWGETLVSAPAGAMPEITPVTQVPNINFDNMQAQDVDLQLGVDANRDGNITFDAADATSATKPYRFWVNDDQDTDSGDVVPATLPDCASDRIQTVRDLEDFARLAVSIQGLTNEITQGKFLIGLKWKNTTGNPQIKIFEAVEANGGISYLTSASVAQQQVTLPYNAAIQNRSFPYQTTITKDGAFLFSTFFWENLPAEAPTIHLLFEGCSTGKEQLVITINKPDGTELAEAGSVWLDLEEAANLFERAHIGNVSTTFSDMVNTTNASVFASDYTPAPNSDEAKQLVVFVHGWNDSPAICENYAETMFKRLWWQGYKGRFAALQWPTLTGLSTYNCSEYIAFRSAQGTLAYFDWLKSRFPDYSINVAAHSMGNIVMMETLKLQLAAGANDIDNYALMQGAVPAHCYDADAPICPSLAAEESDNPTPNTYLGYPGAINNALNGSMANFFNANDYALNAWVVNEFGYKPDGSLGYYIVPPLQPYRFPSTLVTDPRELMAFIARPRSYAVGAQLGVQGVIHGPEINLNAQYGFGDAESDHAGQFNRSIQNTDSFYHTLLNTLFPPE
jgi:hypothetical protein